MRAAGHNTTGRGLGVWVGAVALGLALGLGGWGGQTAQAAGKTKDKNTDSPVAADEPAARGPAGTAARDWPASAKDWLPWALQGQESVLCPRQFDDASQMACVWQGQLSVKAGASGAGFNLTVQVYGPAAWVELPGEAAYWPHAVRVNGRSVAVTARDGLPVVWLEPGRHAVEGEISWASMPQDLKMPSGMGALDLTVDGRAERRSPSADGRVWLRQTEQDARSGDALTVRTLRRIEDTIPMVMRTRFEITVSGKAREVELPAAALPGWVPRSLESRLPVRLQDDGRLRVQARPGQWSVELESQHMQPLASLTLPAGGASSEEVWAFEARNELRVLSVEGPPSVDPKQVDMPDDWRSLPAYRLKAGDTLKLLESRRGNANPGPDALTLARTVWLDFDGQGYTVQDRIQGKLSRSTRLEMAAPGVLGRASSEGQDQPITRLGPQSPAGVALRSEQANLEADSRIEGPLRELSASGWLMDFDSAQTQLNLPPGWRLLHASGPDDAGGAWTSRWTLWDFFFVLLSTLAAAKLLGWRAGALLGAALVLSWHMHGAPPRWLWLALLAGIALVKVLPSEVARQRLAWASRAAALGIGLALLPYGIEQVRLSMYPALELSDAGDAAATSPAAAATASPAAMEEVAEVAEPSAESTSVRKALPAPPVAMSRAYSRLEGSRAKVPPSALDEGIDPRARVQTGPGLPRWSWSQHTLRWQGPVQKSQSLQLWLIPPWGTVLLRLGSLLLMAAALWQLCRLGGLIPPRPSSPEASPGRPADASPQEPTERIEPSGVDIDLELDAPRPAGAAGAVGAAGAAGTLNSWAVLGLCGLGGLWGSWGPLGTFAMGATVAAALALPQPGWARAPGGEGGAVGAGLVAAGTPSLPWPSAEQLEELRRRAAPPPPCLPHCVDVARLWVNASGSRISLRLELHAQAAVALPLPGQGSNWQPHRVSLDEKDATVRRDAAGTLWLSAPKGVSQVVLEADAGDNTSVDINLPLPVRQVQTTLEGWSLSGLDARGLASGALMLAREAPRAASADRSTERDSLPPLVRVTRTLTLGLNWQMQTRIERISASRSPMQVQIRLLSGERVTDDTVKVEDGLASVQLGQQDALEITSQLQPISRLDWAASASPNQIEEWVISASPQWQPQLAEAQGIAPIWHYRDGRWNPSWQPWPGEKLSLALAKPQGVPGQTFTIDQLQTTVTPGTRASDYRSQIDLRTSLGGNHRLQLPAGAELLAVALNEETLPLRLEGRALTLPIPPGAHTLKVSWRLPEGMQGWMRNAPLQAGSAGVNERLQIQIPADRIALAMGGPLIGPAALLWGVLVVVLALAGALARLRALPMGSVGWALLGLGLAPVSLWGLGLVVAWFLALRQREQWAQHRWVEHPPKRWVFNGLQLLFILSAVVVAGALLNALQVGLLGYPDLMIAGNGSSARELNWYADRFGTTSSQAWVLSIPVWVYRVLMLLWALWLASALLGWLRWAWAAFSAGGVWQSKEAKKPNT